MRIHKTFALFIIVFCLTSCNKIKYNIPTLTTNEIVLITGKAQCDYTLISDGGKPIIERGVCWGNNQDPTITDIKKIDNTLNANSIIYTTVLNAGSSFYIRPYATNSEGTAYGKQILITTP